MKRKSELCMVLEIILLQDHIKEESKAVNGINWDENWRKDHVQKFSSFVLGKTDLFSKPRDSGSEPCYQEFSNRSEPNLIIDRHETTANSDKKQTSSQQEASLRFTDPRYSLSKHFTTWTLLTVSLTRASYTNKI